MHPVGSQAFQDSPSGVILIHLKVLICLLGADPDKVSPNGEYVTALHVAAKYNHSDVIRYEQMVVSRIIQRTL